MAATRLKIALTPWQSKGNLHAARVHPNYRNTLAAHASSVMNSADSLVISTMRVFTSLRSSAGRGNGSRICRSSAAQTQITLLEWLDERSMMH